MKKMRKWHKKRKVRELQLLLWGMTSALCLDLYKILYLSLHARLVLSCDIRDATIDDRSVRGHTRVGLKEMLMMMVTKEKKSDLMHISCCFDAFFYRLSDNLNKKYVYRENTINVHFYHLRRHHYCWQPNHWTRCTFAMITPWELNPILLDYIARMRILSIQCKRLRVEIIEKPCFASCN